MTFIPETQSFEAFEQETLAVAKGPPRPNFARVWFHEVGRVKPQRNWLLKNLLLAKTFGIVYGPPGCGKSFLVSDMCLSAAKAAIDTGVEAPRWFGYKHRPFGVVYVVAEGRDDFEVRLHAWRTERGIGADVVLPFVFLPTSIDMRSGDVDTTKLAADISAISAEMMTLCGVVVELTVIDTVARALAGANENASEVMSAFVGNCGRLQETLGTTVLGVHHGGKEAGRGPRGHEALHGAADFEIEVTPAVEGAPNAWTVRKLKAGPGGATHRFRLRSRTVGEDADGDPITSCVVTGDEAMAEAAKEKPKGFRVNQTEMELLQVLRDTIERKGVIPPADLKTPVGVTLVATERDVKEAFWERYASGEDGDDEQVRAKLRQRWSRAYRKMLQFRVIGAAKPWLWFSGKPVQGLTLRGFEAVTEPSAAVTDAVTPELQAYADAAFPEAEAAW